MTRPHAAERLNDMAGFGRCDHCGKIRYKTRKAAKAAIRRITARRGGRDGRLYVYTCDGWFHFGHQPSIITRGEVDRASFDPNRRGPGGGS